MSWYKLSQTITTFEERNITNARIHHLEDVQETLKYASDLVYQTQRGARGIVHVLLVDKVLSSFPDVKDVLTAADKIAMDSPRRFAEYCLRAVDDLDRKVKKLKAERKKATDIGPSRKGLI